MLISFNTLDGIALVNFVGWYIRTHKCAPYKNPMESVTSNDGSALLCTSLWFKPWRDVYNNGASEDFQGKDDGRSIWSDSSNILEVKWDSNGFLGRQQDDQR